MTFTPTKTPTATFTVTPNLLCNKAQFIKDVTIPDGSILRGGIRESKVWEVKNVGSCVWNKNYKLKAVNNSTAINVPPVSLTKDVLPGETVQLSVAIDLPIQEGSFEVNWMLESDLGEIFGVGDSGKSPLWLKVIINNADATNTPIISLSPTVTEMAPTPQFFEIKPGTFIVNDFYQETCDFEWSINNTSFQCEENSLIRREPIVFTENGTGFENGIVIDLSNQSSNSTIIATTNSIDIEAGDKLVMGVGCYDGALECSVLVNLVFTTTDGASSNLWTIGEFYDGQISVMEIDLSQFTGKTGTFSFTASSLGQSQGDVIVWIEPRVLRSSSPTPTVTQLPMPTSTSTPTTVPSPQPSPTATPAPTPVATDQGPLAEFIEFIIEYFRNLFSN